MIRIIGWRRPMHWHVWRYCIVRSFWRDHKLLWSVQRIERRPWHRRVNRDS